MYKQVTGLRTPTSTVSLMQSPVWLPQVFADLQRHEGFRKYAYPDPLSPIGRRYPATKYGWGKRPAMEILTELGLLRRIPEGKPWTVGYGFTDGVNERTVITKEQANQRLIPLIHEHALGLDRLLPGWRTSLPKYVQEVLVNLIFNLGEHRLATFKQTLGMVKSGKYAEAGINLRKSLWYKQVGSRGKELTERLIDGKVQDHYKV